MSTDAYEQILGLLDQVTPKEASAIVREMSSRHGLTFFAMSEKTVAEIFDRDISTLDSDEQRVLTNLRDSLLSEVHCAAGGYADLETRIGALVNGELNGFVQELLDITNLNHDAHWVLVELFAADGTMLLANAYTMSIVEAHDWAQAQCGRTLQEIEAAESEHIISRGGEDSEELQLNWGDGPVASFQLAVLDNARIAKLLRPNDFDDAVEPPRGAFPWEFVQPLQ